MQCLPPILIFGVKKYRQNIFSKTYGNFPLVLFSSLERRRVVFVLKHFSGLRFIFLFRLQPCSYDVSDRRRKIVVAALPLYRQWPKIKMLFVARRLLCESHRQVETTKKKITTQTDTVDIENLRMLISTCTVISAAFITIMHWNYVRGNECGHRRTNGFPFTIDESRLSEKINGSTSNWMMETLISTLKIA